MIARSCTLMLPPGVITRPLRTPSTTLPSRLCTVRTCLVRVHRVKKGICLLLYYVNTSVAASNELTQSRSC